MWNLQIAFQQSCISRSLYIHIDLYVFDNRKTTSNAQSTIARVNWIEKLRIVVCCLCTCWEAISAVFIWFAIRNSVAAVWLEMKRRFSFHLTVNLFDEFATKQLLITNLTLSQSSLVHIDWYSIDTTIDFIMCIYTWLGIDATIRNFLSPSWQAINVSISISINFICGTYYNIIEIIFHDFITRAQQVYKYNLWIYLHSALPPVFSVIVLRRRQRMNENIVRSNDFLCATFKLFNIKYLPFERPKM